MTTRRVLGALALVLVVLVGAAAPASAHAQLDSSSPADGAVVPTAPKVITLKFSESVTVNLGGVRVFNGKGKRVDAGNSRHAGADDTVSVGLQGTLPDGGYIVSWRVISADSHPVHGGFQFSVGTKSALSSGLVSSLSGSGGDKVWQVLAAILRIIAYIGISLAAGGAVLLALIGAEPDRRRLVPVFTIAGAVGAAAVVLGLPIQATLATGLGAGAIAQSGVLSQVLGEGVGTSLLAAVLGVAILVTALRRPAGPRTWPATLVGAALAIGSFALAGHTRITAPAWLLTTVDLAHLLAGSVWFGGLVVLVVVMNRLKSETDPRGAAAAVATFSSIASVALTIVAAAGFTLGWYEVGAARAITSTTYGRLLLVKVAVVGLIAMAGAYNHFGLVPTIETLEHDDARWATLRRTLRAEAIGLVAVLAITGVLVNVTPAKTAAGIGTVSSVTAPLGKGTVNITIDPNRAGANSVHIYLLDSIGRQVDSAQTLSLEFTQASHDIGPIDRPAVKAGPGHWQYDGDAISLAGQWEIAVVARVTEFDEERAVLDIKVNP